MNPLTQVIIHLWKAAPAANAGKQYIYATPTPDGTVVLASGAAVFEFQEAKESLWRSYAKVVPNTRMGQIAEKPWTEVVGVDPRKGFPVEEVEPTKKELATWGDEDVTVFASVKGQRYYMNDGYYQLMRAIVDDPIIRVFLYGPRHPLKNTLPPNLQPFLIFEKKALIGIIANRDMTT